MRAAGAVGDRHEVGLEPASSASASARLRSPSGGLGREELEGERRLAVRGDPLVDPHRATSLGGARPALGLARRDGLDAAPRPPPPGGAARRSVSVSRHVAVAGRAPRRRPSGRSRRRSAAPAARASHRAQALGDQRAVGRRRAPPTSVNGRPWPDRQAARRAPRPRRASAGTRPPGPACSRSRSTATRGRAGGRRRSAAGARAGTGRRARARGPASRSPARCRGRCRPRRPGRGRGRAPACPAMPVPARGALGPAPQRRLRHAALARDLDAARSSAASGSAAARERWSWRGCIHSSQPVRSRIGGALPQWSTCAWVQTSSRTCSTLQPDLARARARGRAIEPGSCIPHVDQHDPVAGGQRPRVAVRDARPRQRQPQPPDAGHDALAPPDLPPACVGLRIARTLTSAASGWPATPLRAQGSPTASGWSAAASRGHMNVYLIEDAGGGVTLFDAGIQRDGRRVAAAARALGGHRPRRARARARRTTAGPRRRSARRCSATRTSAPTPRGDGGLRYFDDRALRTARRLGAPAAARPLGRRTRGVAGTVAEGDDVAGFHVVHLPGHARGRSRCPGARRLALTVDTFYTLDPQTGIHGRPRVTAPRVQRSTPSSRRDSIRKLAALAPRPPGPATPSR